MTSSSPALTAPSAVLFDLDGTLVDTVERRISGWRTALDAHGLPVTREGLAPLIGIDGRRLAREIAAAAGRSLTAEDIETLDRTAGEVFATLNETPIPLPGFAPLVRALDERGVPWAIATSSRREQVAASVLALGLAVEPRIVDASHVAHAKPAPDLLLLAAEQLSVATRGLLVRRRLHLGHARRGGGRHDRDRRDRGLGRGRRGARGGRRAARRCDA